MGAGARYARHLFLLVALAMLALTACTERFLEHQRRQVPTFRPPLEAYARRALLHEAKRMQRAQNPYQWNRMLFHLGVCYQGEIERLPKTTYRETMSSACSMLGRTQKEFAYQCESGQNCTIGPDARAALQRAIDVLDRAAPNWAEDEAGQPDFFGLYGAPVP